MRGSRKKPHDGLRDVRLRTWEGLGFHSFACVISLLVGSVGLVCRAKYMVESGNGERGEWIAVELSEREIRAIFLGK